MLIALIEIAYCSMTAPMTGSRAQSGARHDAQPLCPKPAHNGMAMFSHTLLLFAVFAA
jgi:hypothetical protein